MLMNNGKGTITRRMDIVLEDLQSQFSGFYTRTDFEETMNSVKKAKSDRPSKLKKLFNMFDRMDIPYEIGMDNSYYERIIENSNLPSFDALENKMISVLYSQYKKYPSTENFMGRIVDKLCNPEDHWEDDPLRLRILKQFIKYGNYLKDAGFGGETVIKRYVKDKIGRERITTADILTHIDDNIFLELEKVYELPSEKKDPKLKNSGSHGLLKAVDDLATGKFRVEGATKKCLYFFAMVYNMTFGSTNIDDTTDIEKNLFVDYYSNNLLRFISNAYKGKLSHYELDPSGQGINYKNFAEVIFLYYISQNISPQEKISKSCGMIEHIKTIHFKKKEKNEAKDTKYYRKAFGKDDDRTLFTENALNLDETEFERFISENYDCDLYVGSYKKGDKEFDQSTSALQIEIEQNSAFQEYQKIINNMLEMGLKLENCNYGLWFTDVSAFLKKGYKNLQNEIPGISREEAEDFLQLLLAVNSFIGCIAKEEDSKQNINQEWNTTSENKIKALFVNTPRAITRTSIIVAYYYYFNAKYAPIYSEKISFEEVYTVFSKEINEILKSSYYPTINSKNLFDILVIFSSYAYFVL